ncbi:type II secretion system protein [Candidatus Saccharibacteria bacterium]|nr:type II secretion system protein [Candidatus Saccharibacteria bacterium]MBH1973086.1 type II secretion system protein [Candidatus Saccharibacteria bacterium]MBH1990672.1 type II secretion system protein [Candidatus Saccharibacteria bacterium]
MNAVSKNKQSGFTIIEVVLVLAIAGLIFLMVFVALPTLQRNQRDTQRKQDLSRVMTAIASYTQNNKGSIPTNWSKFNTDYLQAAGDSFVDPTFGPYTINTSLTDAPTGATSTIDKDGNIYVYPKKKCGEGESLATGGERSVAFMMKLEGGGIACQSR